MIYNDFEYHFKYNYVNKDAIKNSINSVNTCISIL